MTDGEKWEELREWLETAHRADEIRRAKGLPKLVFYPADFLNWMDQLDDRQRREGESR